MAGSRAFTISVGRRIALLIIAEAVMIGVLIGHVTRSLSTLAVDLEYSRRFILAPTEALPDAVERMSAVETELELHRQRAEPPPFAAIQRALGEIDALVQRYRVEWMAADSPSRDALRFREELAQTGQLNLLDDERSAVDTIASRSAKLHEVVSRASSSPEVLAQMLENVREMKRGLRMLLGTNVRFVAVDHELHEERANRARTYLVSIGVVAFVLTILLGLHIQNAIGPRITAMARKVRVFQETGDFTRTVSPGSDEIAVLANALDAGLSAIRERDREREKFLAVVAHELKTPLTSITGFVHAALESPDHAIRRRALDVVRRQTARLNRLVQDLLLAASAHRGQLAFQPKPTDARSLVQKALGELENGRGRFELDDGTEVCLLADDDLLGHALWQILSYASAVAEKGSPVHVRIARRDARVKIDVAISKLTISWEELERAFLPFASVQYEGGGLRYAVGLYLSREIAGLHGGMLSAVCGQHGEATLRLELPA
jgi:signal transduction histidine kinase